MMETIVNMDDTNTVYLESKAAKVGSEIQCPYCGTMHTKTTYHKVFCSNGKKDRSKNCKDHFWNRATETRRGQTAWWLGDIR